MSDAAAPTGDASGGDSTGTGSTPRRWWWSKPARNALKIVAVFFVFYFFVLPLIPGFRKAVDDLQQVNPALLLLGLTLQLCALGSYSMLTRAALPRGSVSVGRMLRIQLSTRALASVVPGGSAAGSALGYRLLTLSGVEGPDAGFALATAGLGSAVVLNIIFWTGLLVSIPLRGVNPFYGTAAVIGLVLITLLMVLVIGLLKGQARAERALRSLARRFRFDEDHAASVVRQIAARLRELASDPKLLSAVIGWATANWLLDAASLWVFLRAFGGDVPLDGLIVAFGLANIICSFPITPGGLGIVEGVYIPTLVGFGLNRERGHPRRPHLPPGPVLVADPARGPRLPEPAGRSVVHRAPRSPGALPGAGQGGDRDLRERARVGRALRPSAHRPDHPAGAGRAAPTRTTTAEPPTARRRSGGH